VPATETPLPGTGQQATLQGRLTLDGKPLEASFLGARVVKDGRAAACQDAIPSVYGGSYDLPVASAAEVRGCGEAGAAIILWTYVNDRYVFSKETIPWPGDGRTAQVDATFSSAAPEGASAPVTEFKGHLFDAAGQQLPGGTAVEAFVGDVLCGVTSLRRGDVTEGYYTLIVVGPESVPGCERGAMLTFRLDGHMAAETAVNHLGGDAGGGELDLSLK
jgi:hypothetical protein